MEVNYNNSSALAGVYTIRNNVNNKIYIGSTKRFRTRKTEHLSRLKNNVASPYLQNDWNKYGEEAFVFQVEEIVLPCKQELLAAEQKWLDKFYDNQTNCYNINNLASSRLGSRNVTTPEKQKLMSDERKNRHKNKEYNEKFCHSMQLAYQNNKEVFEKGLKLGRAMQNGKKVSLETRKKISQNALKRFSSQEELEKLAQRSIKYHVAFIDPNNVVHDVENVLAFCRKHKHNHSAIYRMIYGKKQQYKGWRLYVATGNTAAIGEESVPVEVAES